MNKLKTGLLAVVILGLAGTLLVQSNNISQLRTELVDKNQQAQESQKLLKELADLRTRLEDAEKIAFASSLELAGLRSKATQSRRMKEENRKLAARQQELLAERQELIERSRKAAEP